MSKKDLQILKRECDETGVHLIVKDKSNGFLHIEGHSLAKKNLGNKPILKETPTYFFPVPQEYVNEQLGL